MFRVFADSLVCLHFIMVNYWNERASKRDREFEKGLFTVDYERIFIYPIRELYS